MIFYNKSVVYFCKKILENQKDEQKFSSVGELNMRIQWQSKKKERKGEVNL